MADEKVLAEPSTLANEPAPLRPRGRPKGQLRRAALSTLAATGDLGTIIEAVQASRFSPDDLQKILTTVTESSATAMKRSLKPENETHPGVSAYSYPEGEVARPKPALTHETFFVGTRLTEETLTPREITLCNTVTTDRQARAGMWTAKLEHHGEHTRLYIQVPCKTVDERMNLPSLSQILTELLDGPEAANPESLMDLVADLRAKVATLERRTTIGSRP